MRVVIIAIGLILTAAGPKNGERPNMLTHGAVQMTLKVGQTTQADVIDAFGAPNITTLDGQGHEVWVYDRQSMEANAKSSGFSVGALFGGLDENYAGGFGVGFGSNRYKSKQSSRTMTLVIRFDETKRVIDFKSRSSSF